MLFGLHPVLELHLARPSIPYKFMHFYLPNRYRIAQDHLETKVLEPHLLPLMPGIAHVDDPRALLGGE